MRLLPSLKTGHYRFLAVLWTAGILLAITLPTGRFPDAKPGLGVDKVAHVVLFAGFGLLWLRSLCPPRKRGLPPSFPGRGLLLFLIGILFAVGTEVLQHVAPIERAGGPYDAMADVLGLLLAFAGYYVYHGPLSERSST